jgi:hypothetical protein
MMADGLFSCIHFGMDDWGNWRLNLVSMDTDHFIKHPKFSRDELHLKRLTITDADGLPCSGLLEADSMRSDNRYVLRFNQQPVSSSVLGDTVYFHSGKKSLDQFTVDRIRAREENDSVENCDFVCVMPHLSEA